MAEDEHDLPTEETNDASPTPESQPILADNSHTEQLLDELKDQLKGLEDKFDHKIAEDEYKNTLFDKLYDELSSYKKDLYAKLVRPFINETISLLSDYERVIDKIDTFDREKLIDCVKDIPDDLERMLDNNGVERYTDEAEKFNPKTQRVIKTVFTGNQNADNTIAEHIRKGYRWESSVIKPEMVAIFKYKEGYEEPKATEDVHEVKESESVATTESEPKVQPDTQTDIIE